MKKSYQIIRPVGLKPLPDRFEERIAEICAKYFQSDIEFVVRGNHTTPGIKVRKTKQFWEIKSIRSNSMHAIEDNLRKANRQSNNLIVSLLRASKLDVKRTKVRMEYILKNTNVKFARVILITKSEKVIDIK